MGNSDSSEDILMTISSPADRRSALESAIQAGIDAAAKELHTCLPGEVVSFTPSTQLADIQLTIKRKQSDQLVNIPLLSGVPVRYFKGSSYGVTFPLSPGDNVLVIFAERSIDTWLLNGGIQDPADIRRHSFSDAFALPMMYSQQAVIPNFDASNLQIRTLDGSAKITVKSTGEITIDTTGDTIITSNKTTINNDLLVTGSITGQTGLAITGIHPTTGVGGKFTGDIEIDSGDVTLDTGTVVVENGDVEIDGLGHKDHAHDEVQSGTDTSGGPV